MNKVEIHTTDWQKILAMNMVTEGLVAKIHDILSKQWEKYIAWRKWARDE